MGNRELAVQGRVLDHSTRDMQVLDGHVGVLRQQ